ncbi:Uncharacterised protein [Escherichia coli]|nr:Uncharacterised protein [Escherichia coli]
MMMKSQMRLSKQMLISDATDFINSRQWQGKAALEDLKKMS